MSAVRSARMLPQKGRSRKHLFVGLESPDWELPFKSQEVGSAGNESKSLIPSPNEINGVQLFKDDRRLPCRRKVTYVQQTAKLQLAPPLFCHFLVLVCAQSQK